jgi:hypothetical protein
MNGGLASDSPFSYVEDIREQAPRLGDRSICGVTYLERMFRDRE